MKGETRERTVEGRKVIRSLDIGLVSEKGTTVQYYVYSNGIIVVTIIYASETWTWNESQRSRIQAVKMCCLRRDYGGRRMDGKSNNKYDIFSNGRDM